MYETWEQIVARLDADPAVDEERKQMILDDYRAEADELSGLYLNGQTGEAMRADGAPMPGAPWPPAIDDADDELGQVVEMLPAARAAYLCKPRCRCVACVGANETAGVKVA